MRNLFYALTTLAGLALFSCGPTYVVQNPNPAPPPPPAQPAPEATYQNFYDALSPYGEWIDNPEYGYVWMPNAGPDFKPYATNGNWVYTDEGWAWNSDYSWGWAPFHYGRWFYQDGYGWMWIPGNEWAPAWVTWRRSSDYYGWAPLGPSVSINVAVNGGYNPPAHYWCFVPQQYVASRNVNNYYVNEHQNTTIINNTTVIHNTTIVNNTYNNTTVVNNRVNNRVTVNNYAGGPDPGEVARVSGNQLRPVAVRESNTPGGNRSEGSYAIFRPVIRAAQEGNNNNGNASPAPRPAPTRVQNLNNVRPVNTTIYNNNRGNINNTNVNNTTINNNTTNTNITNNNTTNNNTFNNQPANQGQFNRPFNQPVNQPQPATQPNNPNGFHPNNTRFVPGASTNNGNPAVTNPAVTPAPTQPVQAPPNGNPGQAGGLRVPPTGTDNGNGNGYRNNGNGNVNGNGNRNNGNGNSNGFRNNGTANNGNPGAGNANGNNGNGRGNGNAGNGNGNSRPGQPVNTANQGRPPFRPMPKPKDTPKPANPNHP